MTNILIKRTTNFGKDEFDVFDSGYKSIFVDIDCSEFVFDRYEKDCATFEIKTEEELDKIISKLESLRKVFI